MAGPLLTPEAVIAAADVRYLANYADVIALNDAAGFSVKRDYPAGTAITQALTPSGKKNYCVLIHFVARAPTAPSGIQRVELAARLRGAWEETHQTAWDTYDYRNPDCPTPEAVATARRLGALSLDFDEFYYDAGEERFYAESGPVTGEEMLNYAYATHCRTLEPLFRLRYRLKSAVLSSIRGLVWNSQEIALWLLEHGYEIVPKTGEKYVSPFHRFKLSEFQRATDAGGTTFFGFRVSPRSLFSNMVLLGAACVLLYYTARRKPLVRAVYHSTPLTTMALLLGFMVAHEGGPFVLKLAVCGLARLKRRTMFFRRKVTPTYRAGSRSR